MNTIIKKSLQALMFVPVLALGVSVALPSPTSSAAACTFDATSASLNNGANCARGDEQKASLFGDGGIITTITRILLFLIGAVSVIMLIIGGFRYVLSAGNSSAVASAKNTIIYAVIGVIVALLGFAIINFVIGTFNVNGAAAAS